MRRKLALLLALVTIVCSLTACAGVTHFKECDDEIYKDGYCKYHYELNAAKEKIDDIGKGLFDLFDD